jgi:hypothetical protein
MRKIMAIAIAVFVFAGSTAHAQINDPVNQDGLAYARRLAVVNEEPERPAPIPTLWTTDAWNRHCVGMEAAILHFTPARGWDVNRMSGIAYRESNCVPTASNSCCHGIFQIHESWIRQLRDNTWCGITSQYDLYDPWKNICAAAYVYQASGIGAWSTS